MRVLVACEFSGTVRDAFTRAGHEAMSCDLLPPETRGVHFQGDVLELLRHERFDLIIAHPPCTYLTNSGVRWMYDTERYPNRWQDMVEGAVFFRAMLEAPAPLIAVENPIMHKWAAKIVGRRQDQVVQPWQFGHGETKGVGLWLKGLPPLIPTNIVEGREARVHKMSPGPDRWKERSRFFRGIADAMAAQWGGVTAEVAA